MRKNRTNNRVCILPNNCMYCFPGSFVEHSVAGVTQGSRIIVGLFCKWNVQPVDIISYWTGKVFVCPACLRAYGSCRTLR
jgi:hypothetical protein